jgi:virginiamycin B lyase
MEKRMKRRRLLAAFAGIVGIVAAACAHSVTITVIATDGKPLATAMVREVAAEPRKRDTSDGDYPAPGKINTVDIDITRFTDAAGRATWQDRGTTVKYIVRKPGYEDASIAATPGQATLGVTLRRETDTIKLAEAKPANVWLGALDLGDDARKKHFMLQCGFCHQQGNAFLRRERTSNEWREAIDRMVRYGGRLSTPDQHVLPDMLVAGWRRLREHPELLAEPAPWDASLAGTVITEWPIGDAMSQTHDQLLAADGNVYVADNIQDRVYRIAPLTNEVTVFKVPHRAGDAPGGLISARLREFPRHDDTSNAHSLAQSAKDGHIFITPSAQQRLVEFDPKTGAFTLHEIGGGFYPHTIRIDAQDRVWFTLALSNQIAMFDRQARRFTLYDLPTRGVREWLTASLIRPLFKLMSWGVPLANWLPVDRDSTGVPLPYGIDLTPDGMVWFARLHTDEIGRIDPATGKIALIATPFAGPRRLRSDGDGNLWIVAFPESAIVRYEPKTGRFTRFDLPVVPKGSETPYSLNVDKKRAVVWVNGNQSDSLYAFDIKALTWRSVPLPRRVAFTRDIEVADDGTVYTSTSSFPSWHVEDGQPTMIRVQTNTH